AAPAGPDRPGPGTARGSRGDSAPADPLAAPLPDALSPRPAGRSARRHSDSSAPLPSAAPPATPAAPPAPAGRGPRASAGVLPTDLYDLLAAGPRAGIVWSGAGEDLNVNLLHFDRGAGVARHTNAEVEVLLFVLAGEGILELEGEPRPLSAGQLCLIPKGVERAIRSAGGPFSYLTCHRRRAGLWPGG